MSDSYCPPPIFRLNSDVLLKILSMNSNMFNDKNALTNTRYTSQVCSTWRTTMLEEPILWARLIDFDILHTLRSETWALELIRRSKTAPLWVRGAKLHCEVDRNGYRFLKPYSFLLTVVDVHWERIQRLVLMAHVLMFIDMSFCPIYRPAPLLDTFHIQFEQSALPEHFSTMHRFVNLFDGSAPMIRHFSAYYQKINYNASWWHNLRSLDFGGVDNICEILTVLSAIPNLEYLKATSSEEAVPLLPRSAVSLPKLNGLDLHLNYTEMVYALENLKIPSECALNLATRRFINKDRLEDHSACTMFCTVVSSIAQVSKRYFRSHRARSLSIRCQEGSFKMYDNMDDAHSSFKIMFQYCQSCPRNPTEVYAHFSCPEFASIKQLKVVYQMLDFSPQDLVFLQIFSSVEILHACEQELNYVTATQDFLSKTSNINTTLLPKLRRIVLHSMNVPHIPSWGIVNFVLSRSEDGFHISIIDITEFCEYVTTGSRVITRLQAIPGLKVNFHSVIVGNVEEIGHD